MLKTIQWPYGLFQTCFLSKPLALIWLVDTVLVNHSPNSIGISTRSSSVNSNLNCSWKRKLKIWKTSDGWSDPAGSYQCRIRISYWQTSSFMQLTEGKPIDSLLCFHRSTASCSDFTFWYLRHNVLINPIDINELSLFTKRHLHADQGLEHKRKSQRLLLPLQMLVENDDDDDEFN